MPEQDTARNNDPFLLYFSQQFNISYPGEILWSHAVNSVDKLERVLHESEVMIIESDLRFSTNGQVIAAHPPVLESDLSLNKLLNNMLNSNKGLKLDFKDPETVVPTLEMLKQIQLRQPVLLNADVLQGNGASPSRFNPHEFIDKCRQLYPDGFLSLGWTTVTDAYYAYTEQNVTQMLELVTDLPWVTFPVRACLLPNSWNVLQPLVSKEGYTLSIWNNEPVDDVLQNWIYKNTDPKKTFYDFIDDNKDPLRFW